MNRSELAVSVTPVHLANTYDGGVYLVHGIPHSLAILLTVPAGV